MRTWFQHDFNASIKQGLSQLLEDGGPELYGRFWLFQELFYSMQQHRDTFQESVLINEKVLMKHLRVNSRTLPKVLETFRKRLGILSETFQKPSGNVWKTTMPKALIYIHRRSK